MNSRTEKLAKSLAKLSLEYTDGEFEDALKIIQSGKLFQHASKAVTAAKSVKKRRSRNASERGNVEGSLESILSKLPTEEKDSTAAFLNRVLDPKNFASLISLREYLERHGISLPKKTPARSELVRRIAIHLVMVNEIERKSFIEGADNVARPESSLKRWSDLIVKNGQSQP